MGARPPIQPTPRGSQVTLGEIALLAGIAFVATGGSVALDGDRLLGWIALTSGAAGVAALTYRVVRRLLDPSPLPFPTSFVRPPERPARRPPEPEPPSAPPLADRLGVLHAHPARDRAAWFETWSADGVRIELPRAGRLAQWLPWRRVLVVELTPHRLVVGEVRFDAVDVRSAVFEHGRIVVERGNGQRWRGAPVVPYDEARLASILEGFPRSHDVAPTESAAHLAALLRRLDPPPSLLRPPGVASRPALGEARSA